MPEILIVDNYKPIRLFLRETLDKHEGWHVCGEAQNGQDAIDRAAELRPEVIIMDLQMDDMDGFQASRTILARAPETRIVLLTIHSSEQLAVTARTIGIRAMCSKMEMSGVVDTVERVLRGETSFPKTPEK